MLVRSDVSRKSSRFINRKVVCLFAVGGWLLVSACSTPPKVSDSQDPPESGVSSSELIQTSAGSLKEAEEILSGQDMGALFNLTVQAGQKKDWRTAASAAERYRVLTGDLQIAVWEFAALGELGRLDEALSVLKLMGAAPEGDFTGWARLGFTLFVLTNLDRQIKLWDALAETVEGQEHRYDLWLSRSKLHYLRGENDEALRWAMQLIAEEPTKVHLELGVYLANKSNLPDKGLVALDFLEPSQRVDPELSLWRASLLLDLGMNQEALAVLKEAQGIPEVLYHRSRVAISLGQEDVAQDAWALLPALSEHADLSAKGTYFAAHLAQLLGYYGQAWNWFDHVTEPPWLHEALLAQAMLLTQLAERQEWDRLGGSLEEVRLGLDRVRREAKAPLVKQAWAIEANLMRESNKSEEFLEVLHEAISTDSANDFLLYLRATEALYLGDLALAEQDLRRIIRVDPEDARALNALGYVLADRTSRLVEAYRLIDKALTLEPDNPAILDSMGWVNFRLGRLDEAVYYLEWAYELEKDPVIRDHLIQALEEIGDSDRAVWLREGELEATELSVPMADKESTP